MSAALVDRLMVAMQESKGVPASERTVASVLSALDSSTEGSQAVVGHIMEDFALTQKVLKLANSAMYAPFGAGPASVSAALEVLGSDAVLHLVLGADLISEQELQQDANLSRTLLASELARSAFSERAEDASIATLMVEVGRLMTGRYLPSEAAAIAVLTAQGKDPKDAVPAVLGMSYQELGAELARRWNLPEALRAVINGTGDPALVDIARFSSTASGLIQEGKADAVLELLRGLDVAGVDKSQLGALMYRKVQEAQAIARAEPSANTEAALDALQQLGHGHDGSLEELCKSLLPGLAQALQASRCMVFMLTRNGDQRLRHGHGPALESVRSQLKISAEFRPTAFHAAIQRNTDVYIADVSKLKDASLPDGYRALLPQVTRFIILPITTSRVSGLLYCDWESAGTLSPAVVEALKKLRNMFLPLFPQ